MAVPHVDLDSLGVRSLDDDFESFLSFTDLRKLSADEIERLRLAYEHGSDRGARAAGRFLEEAPLLPD